MPIHYFSHLAQDTRHCKGYDDATGDSYGKSIRDGATKLTLAITDVDTPIRTFEWELK